MKRVVAVDLGGTWMRAASVSSDGKCGHLLRKVTKRHRSREKIIADITDMIKQCRTDIHEPLAIGIPTVLDERNVLVECDNLPTLSGFPLGEYLEKNERVPVKIFNDAACFTVGEWWLGAGKGTENFCGVTLGTGVGVGIVINGNIYHGSHGCAGELWKSPMGNGTVEDMVSGGAIEKDYEKISGNRLGGREIAVLAEQGDPSAREVYARFGNALGNAICFLVNAMDPECVVFGGSVSNAFDFFHDTLAKRVLVGTVAGDRVRLEKSLLGEKAPLLGAARLFWDKVAKQ